MSDNYNYWPISLGSMLHLRNSFVIINLIFGSKIEKLVYILGGMKTFLSPIEVIFIIDFLET